MKKFNVKFQREFEVEVEADTLEIASALARKVLAQFPAGTVKMLSIYAEDYAEPVVVAEGATDVSGVRNDGLAKKVGALLPDPGTNAA